jgi:hypothetical protein
MRKQTDPEMDYQARLREEPREGILEMVQYEIWRW